MTQHNRVRAHKKLITLEDEGKKDLDVNISHLPTPPSSSTSSGTSSPLPLLLPPPLPLPSPPSPPPPPLTRKQRRQALLTQSLASDLSTSVIPTSTPNSPSDAIEPSQTTTLSHKPTKPSNITRTPTPPTLTTMSTPRLLICSIGNPAPYTNTLHSAGHTIVSLLGPLLNNPPFSKSRAHGNGLLSPGYPYTLWKSTSLMNVSGAGVSSAWTTFLRESSSSDECKLIVIHDELELAPGRVNVKAGSNSPKGHNGLKSIRDTLRGQPYTRIGIGIGRPESRDAGVVAGYVLRKMNVEEKRKIEGCVGKVVEELAKLGGA
ncbi:hypothetical protein EYC80_002418 [Monilinia laxa]|uniref:peptidyl-tRNA hydrolase n=1 Tax=Monilinia laxa TaxID=61186 RepID=A0A5N6K3U6_MONLA|nr:hypothetical protein EYC80_002418 [Monilinia laxa]